MNNIYPQFCSNATGKWNCSLPDICGPQHKILDMNNISIFAHSSGYFPESCSNIYMDPFIEVSETREPGNTRLRERARFYCQANTLRAQIQPALCPYPLRAQLSVPRFPARCSLLSPDAIFSPLPTIPSLPFPSI